MISVPILGLDDGVHPFTLSPSAEDADVDAEVFRDIRVDGLLSITNGRILVSFDASATATLLCDRTLVPFDFEASDSFSVLYAPPGPVTEEDDDAVRELAAHTEALDLTEAVRDTLMLALPARRIAPGAEDVEIQTSYGSPEIDDRWEALRSLKEDAPEASPTDAASTDPDDPSAQD
jgi:uncharacterized protein